jgi:hypothetical protein
MVTHTATGKGMTPKWVCATRGWSREDWDAATERLRERGLLDASGDLTERGVALRAEIEDETDRLDRAPGPGGRGPADRAGRGIRARGAHGWGVPGGSDRQG